MSRPLTIRKPNADELHQLHLLYAADGSVSSIAQLLQVHRNTVATDLREFARHGLLALSRPRKLGAPPRLSKQQIAAIWRLADQAPTTLGLPLGRWSLAKLCAYLIRQRIVPTISRVHLRRVLKKGDTHFAASVASSSAPIPIGI